jgi:hypothetical protein
MRPRLGAVVSLRFMIALVVFVFLAAVPPVSPGIAYAHHTPTFNPGVTTLRMKSQDLPVPGDSVRPADAPISKLIFSDDFEAYGDCSRWSSKYPFTVQGETVATGSYAARFTNTGGNPEYGQQRFDTGYTRLFVRLKFYVVEMGSDPVTLMQIRSGSNISIASIRIEPSGEISYLTGATGITARSAMQAAHDEWHELHVMVDTQTSESSLRIWVDNQELTSMRQSVAFGNDPMQVLELGDNSGQRHSDIVLDDILVDDAFIPSTRSPDPVSGLLKVQTYPKWSGISFELDGRTFQTDEAGIAYIDVERWSPDLRSRIAVPDAMRDDMTAKFSQWLKWRDAHSHEVYAAFDLWQPVGLTFTDMQGDPVETGIIDRIIIKNSISEVFVLETSELPVPELRISRTALVPEGVDQKLITYYVDQVVIDGANVVNRSQQRSTFETTRDWQISLLMFSVEFRAVDALFGHPVGDELVVTSPDGTEQRLPLGENGVVALPRMPRGDYHVHVAGGGYSPPRPIRVSRDQVLQIDVISAIDGIVFGGVTLAVAAGLIVAGRPHLVTIPASFLKQQLGAHRGGREGRVAK